LLFINDVCAAPVDQRAVASGESPIDAKRPAFRYRICRDPTGTVERRLVEALPVDRSHRLSGAVRAS